MALTVVSVAYPFAPVTADPVGGAEQVLAQLDRELVAAGHRSVVIACEGSQVAGELVGVPVAAGPIDDAGRAAAHAQVRAAIGEALADAPDALVHGHGIDAFDYLPAEGDAPTLVTLHLPIGWYPARALRTPGARTWLLPVSRSQAASAPGDVALLPPIANGVDLDAYRPTNAKGDGLLVLGRIAPEKGFGDALEAARRADAALIAAGQLFPYPAHRAYHEAEVLPRLDARRRWIGPVAGAEKRRLLARARALLVPSTAPETSSLVAMEALASGTPVIAYRSGALPDIVEHGVTGFIVNDVDAMAAAIGRVGEIDPARCRAEACRRFPLSRTAAAYLALYERLVA